MTNDQLIFLFKSNLGQSLLAAIKGVYNAGYCEGASITPSANMVDYAASKTLPTAIHKVQKPD